MKVNFKVLAIDFTGNPVKIMNKEVCVAEELEKSLFFYGSSGDNVSGDNKYMAYKIGRKLSNGDSDYTAEELAFIKEIAAKTLAAGLYGQIVDLIEGCQR